MNPNLAKLLTRVYPSSWRERYGPELEELLETGQHGFYTVADVVWSALLERISPTRGLSLDQRARPGRFHSLCARAPWAVFCFAPVSLLAGYYFAACLILWIGWTIFLPGIDTPFGVAPQHGLVNFYFQFGKYFYGGAPILVGWMVGIVAVRQRAKALWPLIGFVLVAWIGAAARIRAGRTEIPRGLGHIRMDFMLWPWFQNEPAGLIHAVLLLSIVLLPYWFWRIQIARMKLS